MERQPNRDAAPAGAAVAEAAEPDRFTLRNEAPKRRPAAFNDRTTRQTMLLDGLDCLPGQGDLF